MRIIGDRAGNNRGTGGANIRRYRFNTGGNKPKGIRNKAIRTSASIISTAIIILLRLVIIIVLVSPHNRRGSSVSYVGLLPTTGKSDGEVYVNE